MVQSNKKHAKVYNFVARKTQNENKKSLLNIESTECSNRILFKIK